MPDQSFSIELDNDHRVVGDHRPGSSPGYLFLHGLASMRSGEKSDSLMAHATSRGVAFTRCDFRGHGDSTGTVGHVTIGELIEDTIRVLELFGPKIVVGSSLGGLVGAFAAARRPELVTGLALIAPALGFLHRLERTLDDEGRMWTTDGRSFPLDQRVLEDARRLDERQVARDLNVPTLIVHGDADEVVPHRRSRRFFDSISHDNKALWLVPGGDHRLNEVTHEIWARLDALLGNLRS